MQNFSPLASKLREKFDLTDGRMDASNTKIYRIRKNLVCSLLCPLLNVTYIQANNRQYLTLISEALLSGSSIATFDF